MTTRQQSALMIALVLAAAVCVIGAFALNAERMNDAEQAAAVTVQLAHKNAALTRQLAHEKADLAVELADEQVALTRKLARDQAAAAE